MRNPSVIACGDASPLSQGGLLVQDISPPCQRGDTAEGGGGIPSHRPPCLPPRGRCPRRGRRGPASPVLSLRGGRSPTWRSVTPVPLASPSGGGAPQGRRGLPPNFFILGIDKSFLIIYNKPQEHGSGIKPPLAMTRCPVPCMIQPIITGNPRAPPRGFCYFYCYFRSL